MRTAVAQPDESLAGVVDITNDPDAIARAMSAAATPTGATDTSPDSARAVADASVELRDILATGIVLAGRTWIPVRAPTFEHQNHRVAIVGQSGVIRLFPAFDVVKDDPEGLAAAVLATAFASGALFELLAALLVEQGTTWTPAVARENAMVFAGLTDPADHARLADAILWVVLDFFLSVSGSTRIFLKSLILSGRGAPGDGTTIAGRASSLPNTTPEASSAATSTSGGGTTSSARSPASAAPIR